MTRPKLKDDTVTLSKQELMKLLTEDGGRGLRFAPPGASIFRLPACGWVRNTPPLLGQFWAAIDTSTCAEKTCAASKSCTVSRRRLVLPARSSNDRYFCEKRVL